MANYELAADYYKGEESNRYALSYEFMSMFIVSLQRIASVL